jgi:NTP pyrophosphatase (non-canonical NTP hydrolase)
MKNKNKTISFDAFLDEQLGKKGTKKRVKNDILMNKTRKQLYLLDLTKNVENVVKWASDKSLLKKENSLAQMAKVTEEVGEIASALLKNDEAKLIDGIGDATVTLIILAEQNGLNLGQCLEAAWLEIKDRTGKTVDGTFIKD